MKAKTRDQLREEIAALETERDRLKEALVSAKSNLGRVIIAFFDAVKGVGVQKPDTWETLAMLVTFFFAFVKDATGIDYTESEYSDKYFDDMGFDEVTSISIKRKIATILEVLRMRKEGRSDKEIMDFLNRNNAEAGE